MSKMKHFLRKLHISCSPNDHQTLPNENHHRNNSPSPSPSSTPSSSSSPALAAAVASTTAADDGSTDFNFFEEEFQVQLALAISASDDRDDPESKQIKAAKRMSLGCSHAAPHDGETLVDLLSLRYWNFNVVNYDEKVVDGFYDVYGILSNPNMQGKIPSLVDLQAISISDHADYEVVLVNRVVDHALQQLEREAVSIASECGAAELGPVVSGLIQKIADLVVHSLGGPVTDADDMLTRWTNKSYELRTSLNTIVLPLGRLEVGLSRHRALLFKVLADQINLPCRLVKGSYYTGTDEGAVNIIKIPPESGGGEYIIDLMGAPGTLIPAEMSTSLLQNSGLDITSSSPVQQTVKDLPSTHDKELHSQLEMNSVIMEGSSWDSNSIKKLVGFGSGKAPSVGFQPEGDELHLGEKYQTARFEHEFGNLLPSLGRPRGGSTGFEDANSPVQQMKVNDVSKYVISAAQNPQFAQKLHAVLLESGALPHSDLFSDVNSPPDLVEQRVLSQSCTGGRKIGGELELHHVQFLPYMDRSPVPILGVSHFDCEEHSDGLMQKRWQDSNVSEPTHGLKESTLNSSSTDQPGLSSMDHHFPVDANTVNPGVPLSSVYPNEWVVVRTDSLVDTIPVLGSSTVLPRTSDGGKFQEPSIPYVTDSGHKQLGNPFTEVGAQTFQANAGVVAKHVERRVGVYSPHCQASISESVERFTETAIKDPHISSNSNEGSYSVLDGIAEWEIPWENLQIGERIGLGSYGEVYRADWHGTEVAVKKFLDQDFSGDALEQFRSEIKIMLRLRHPNVVLFMGAVTHPPNLSILTEFLPRGSLYRLLHRPSIQLDEKRRLRMALDVAKGMNYLHTSHPTIVHRDLKSSNLLVDKNWVVKVCDFGLSRLKHHTFLSSKSTAGTPEWMAPEVLRNEQSNEKCDIYSFGVILWELATMRMPWSGMNPMQVVGAVGFQNRRLEIPKEVDPMVAKIICDCWQSDPTLRPSFAQLLAPLKHLVTKVA
ncbi:Protein kinase domain-containing protein [Cinnamomum micranthum f. kanehirae]|uniref:non-specific serine/threonine protein kinase n=1 Tax=Cinnamomum micranthum f. kanehirae TaxID=337451 RepID=A0A3S3QBC6_9MAGN|nr:Protein kinase domain-containing protein [Cinnamomum micranthum f. kanehirae]